MSHHSAVEFICSLLDAWDAETGPHVIPDPPAEVRVGELNGDGWGEWRMVPSPVTPADIDALEEELGVGLPPFYRAFLCSRVLMDFDFGDYTLPAILPIESLKDVRETLKSDFALDAGFVVFGAARGCGDPLCFDVGSRDKDGDCPVVVFNHDFVPTAKRSYRSELNGYAGQVSASFRRFFTSLLSNDPSIYPPPESPLELQSRAAWERVRELLKAKGLPPYFRPRGIDPTDPWAIADALKKLSL